MKTIKCRFFSGTAAAARLIALEEDLFRKKLTALQKAERLVEWAEQLRKTGFYISGQVVRKKRGRPESWITRAMRQLPVVGRSIEARRMEFKRSMKIAAIVPEAKRIIVNFRALADNKTALKAIARESGRNAQVRKAKELAEKAQELRLVTKAKPPAAAGEKSKDRAVKKSPPLQPHSGGLPEASAEGDGADDEPASLQVPKETTLDDLDDFWKRGGRKLWKYASFSVRTAFKEKLDRAPYAATSDVAEFIDKIFCGRKGVNVRQLYAFAKTQGIPRKILRVHLQAHGYKLTKDGPQPAAPRFYRNRNSEWKNQMRVIPDAELEARGMAASSGTAWTQPGQPR